jgi:uncharacterized protein with PIN domain
MLRTMSDERNSMRALVQPPRSSRCELCGGEFKLIEPANRVYGLDNEIFVCVNCGHEQMYVVARDRYAALTH